MFKANFDQNQLLGVLAELGIDMNEKQTTFDTARAELEASKSSILDMVSQVSRGIDASMKQQLADYQKREKEMKDEIEKLEKELGKSNKKQLSAKEAEDAVS